MATYKAPIREINFVLNDVLDVGRLASQCPTFAEATPDVLLGLAWIGSVVVTAFSSPPSSEGAPSAFASIPRCLSLAAIARSTCCWRSARPKSLSAWRVRA